MRTLLVLAMALSIQGCSSADDDDSGSSAAPAPDAGSLCGNGAADPGEECDGANLGGKTCESFAGHGTLSCSTDCKLVRTACLDDPCWGYPCGPYGTGVGDVVDDLMFTAGNPAALDLAEADAMLDFNDLYRRNVEHGGAFKGVLLFISTAWCPYCAAEAEQLESLYQELKDQGILLVGLIMEDSHGNDATDTTAFNYARTHKWTFPAIAGRLPINYWPAGDDRGAVPMHVFLDARNMKIYARMPGAQDVHILRTVLTELAAAPRWNADGGRDVAFDCAPGTGSEHEPNALGETMEHGASLPATLTGALCPAVVADGLAIDEDALDLGNQVAGAVLDVAMRPLDAASDVYPQFQLVRLTGAGRAEWSQLAPLAMGSAEVRRQWMVDTAGHYAVVASDGRAWSQAFYGSGATVPEADACCGGGPTSTYSLTVSAVTPQAGSSVLELGAAVNGPASASSLVIYPLDVVAGTSYTASLTSSNAQVLDPYLLVYDPSAAATIGFNDDVDPDNENFNSTVQWTAAATGKLWVVPSFYMLVLNGGIPEFQLLVQ